MKGLVLKWREETIAILDGSHEARLVVDAFNAETDNGDTSDRFSTSHRCETLAQVYRKVPYVWVEDILYEFLGSHSQAVGSSTVNVMLLKKMVPAVTLIPEYIRDLSLHTNSTDRPTRARKYLAVSVCFPCTDAIRDAFNELGVVVICPSLHRIYAHQSLSHGIAQDGRGVTGFSKWMDLLSGQYMQQIDVFEMHRELVKSTLFTNSSSTNGEREGTIDMMEYLTRV